MKLSIIIPCFNEELSLKKLVDNCLEYINDDIEILLVDNGSVDNTFNALLNLNLPSNIVPIRVEKNIGYGNGILFGLKHAKGEVVSWTHADLQTDVSDVLRGFNLFEKELISRNCMVKGVRKNRNVLDAFFTFSMGVYSSILLSTWMYDINAQPKIFHREFLKEFKNPPLDFSLDLYLVHFFKSNKIAVKTFPVIFNKRLYGEAKGGGSFKGKYKLILRTLKYIRKLKKNLR
jgi:glycosyltransferase involved in cell wall biosynthesis